MTNPSQRCIICLSGLISSGKDTMADYLMEHHNFVRMSFAGVLKDCVAAVFGWRRVDLDGLSPETRIWRDTVDEWWATRLGMPQLTPRWVLQHWGTELFRVRFHSDIWIASLEKQLSSTNANIVVTDGRFPNELALLRDKGATLVLIRRGPDPKWMPTARIACDVNHTNYATALQEMVSLGVHASEWAWANTRYDLELDNSGSKDEFIELIKNQVSMNSVAISP